MPLARDSYPFVQTFNMKDMSYLLYRESQEKPLQSLITSRLSFRKPKTIGLSEYIKDIPDSKLKFLTDISNISSKKQISLYLMINTTHILRADLTSTLSLQKTSVLQLPREYLPKRVLVYEGSIYILESNKVTRVTPVFENFPKFVLEEKNLTREYTDMAVVNGSFAFIRGYSSLLCSSSFSPEGNTSFVLHDKFHHGKFIYAGFDKFIISMTEDESGDAQYYYFDRNLTGDQNNLHSLKITKLRNTGMMGGEKFTQVLHFQEAVYFIFKKNYQVEYFKSDTDAVSLDKKVFGRLYGMIGNYNMSIDAVHPLNAFKISLHRKFRFRKLYVNALNSELVCKKMEELGVGQERVLKANVLTRKNHLNFTLKFKGIKATLPAILSPKTISENKVSPDKKLIDDKKSEEHTRRPTEIHHKIISNKSSENQTIDNGRNQKKNEEEQIKKHPGGEDGENHSKQPPSQIDRDTVENHYKKLLQIVSLICTILLLLLLCLVRAYFKRDFSNIKATHEEMIGGSTNMNSAMNPDDSSQERQTRSNLGDESSDSYKDDGMSRREEGEVSIELGQIQRTKV